VCTDQVCGVADTQGACKEAVAGKEALQQQVLKKDD